MAMSSSLVTTMPTPIITLPIHTIEQARALAGLLRAYIDGQQPDTNDGQDWKLDPELTGIAALYAHLDAGIREQNTCGGVLAYEVMGVFRVHHGGVYRFKCQKCGDEGENDGAARACGRPR